jgi:competence protein ComEC
LPAELQEILLQRKITVHPVRAGWTALHKGTSQSFSLFSPSQNARDINERSIAVFAGEGNEGVLLTADLGRTGFEQMLAAGMPGPITLLKLPHHGSRHSQPEVFLEQTQPSAAFVSSGRGNQYGFPHQQTIDDCTARQIPLFRTDLQGMLTFHVKNGLWHRQTDRDLSL